MASRCRSPGRVEADPHGGLGRIGDTPKVEADRRPNDAVGFRWMAMR